MYDSFLHLGNKDIWYNTEWYRILIWILSKCYPYSWPVPSLIWLHVGETFVNKKCQLQSIALITSRFAFTNDRSSAQMELDVVKWSWIKTQPRYLSSNLSKAWTPAKKDREKDRVYQGRGLSDVKEIHLLISIQTLGTFCSRCSSVTFLPRLCANKPTSLNSVTK